LSAKPLLLEPIYRIEISVPTQLMGICANIIARRRGKVKTAETRGSLVKMSGYLPVAESFGLSTEMRSASSGRAFWQCTFDRWEKVPDGIADKTVAEIRTRKGLPPEVPRPEKFVDEIKKRKA
jgi:elongation factor 2